MAFKGSQHCTDEAQKAETVLSVVSYAVSYAAQALVMSAVSIYIYITAGSTDLAFLHLINFFLFLRRMARPSVRSAMPARHTD